jgi:hypothetical protein
MVEHLLSVVHLHTAARLRLLHMSFMVANPPEDDKMSLLIKAELSHLSHRLLRATRAHTTVKSKVV